MANFDSVLQQLRQEHKQAQAMFEKLQQAISTIESLNGNSAGTTVNGTRPKRTMSAAARRRIAQAQRARWAKFRKQTPQTKAKGSNSGSRRISAAGRKRIAAAARARWARVRAQQRKKAA
jgi:hypothetical protein